jgi:flagellar motor component MotA
MKVLAEVGAISGLTGAVTCTFIDGMQTGTETDAIYRPKTILVVGGGRGAALTWQPVEIAGNPEHIFRPAVQCKLGPGTALHYLSVTYDEEIGG